MKTPNFPLIPDTLDLIAHHVTVEGEEPRRVIVVSFAYPGGIRTYDGARWTATPYIKKKGK